MRLSYLAALGLLCVTACGAPSGKTGSGNDGGMTNADGGQPSGPPEMYPAMLPDVPQVVDQGGPVLASPKVVPIFFANDDAKTVSQLTDFLQKVGGTNYWLTAVQEYGVGAATSTAPVQATDMPTGTVDDTDIQTWLAGKLNSDDPAFPAPDENTVYSLHYPAGVKITQSAGGQGTVQSCQDFGGYHSSLALDQKHNGVNVAYIVIPRCQSFGDLTGLDAITGAESHELIEASTDPYPLPNPAYGVVDDAHLYWLFVLGGGEVGDMCAQDPSAFYKFPELPYTVQRSWSNAAATAGHDPCVPALPNEVYFNAVPELDDTITFSAQGQTVSMKGVTIATGQSKTIQLDLYSDADTNGPWDIKVLDANQFMGGAAHLGFTMDANSGTNGQKLNLTISRLGTSQYHADVFFVVSTRGQDMHMSMGMVGE